MATQILELELTADWNPISFMEGYDHARVLIRSHKRPIGWISLEKDAGGPVSREKIISTLKKQLGKTVIKQALLSLRRETKLQAPYEGISIVICTRNRTAQLATCLDALLKLTYPQYEILVIDNAPSNDDTLKLTNGLPVRYVREDRPGLDWARNRGIAEARYDLVAFTDDDVRVDSYWLEAISKTFAHPRVMGASGFVGPAELETPAQHIFELTY